MYWERRLPHWVPEGSTVFVTWSLAGSRPIAVRANTPNPGKAFLLEDRQLDCASSGPHWLSDPRIAAIFVEALRYGEAVRGLYQAHNWLVMPNHVHLVLTPIEELSMIVGWLKAATANRANRILGRTGSSFWKREYFDHWIRSARDFGRASYVERNPMAAGLAASPEEWPWSSAAVPPPVLPAVF